MADVFVSYKSEDRTRVQPLVTALEADGIGVWWDAHITSGSNWRDTIQQELAAAACVIVVWSERSVGPEGRFVRDEATRAQRRGVYLPLRIDDVEPPLGFGETQAMLLSGWKGNRADPRYQRLLACVRSILEGKPQQTVDALPVKAHSGINRRHLLAGGGGVLALGAVGVGAWSLLGSSPAAANGIAVLPFANLSGDPAQKYFSDGLAEELRGALSRVGDLKVIGRISSEAVRDEDASTACRRLGVGTVLTGSVRRSPSMIRVQAQLIDGKDGAQRWTESYDRAPNDVLAVQTDIAEKVADALSIELGKAERVALTLGGTKNAAAQDLYLKAKALWLSDTSETAKRQAIALLDAALALDPNFAEAHAAKSRNLVVVTGQYVLNPAMIESEFLQAEIAAKRALEIAPTLASGHAALALLAEFRLDAATALTLYQRARSLSKLDGAALSNLSILLASLGRHEAAVRLADELVALDPLDPRAYSTQAKVLFYARRYVDAIGPARRSLQMAPKRESPVLYIGYPLVMLGKHKEALSELARLDAGDVYRMTGEAIAYAKLGDRVAFDRTFAKLRQAGGDGAHYQYAEVHAQLGDIDEAFGALDQAWKFRDPGLIEIKGDPFLDPLRRDPRLTALERRLKLP